MPRLSVIIYRAIFIIIFELLVSTQIIKKKIFSGDGTKLEIKSLETKSRDFQ